MSSLENGFVMRFIRCNKKLPKAELDFQFPYGSPQNLAEKSARFLFYGDFMESAKQKLSFC